jgi:c-di-GMP-binding flagellar brake protein YcgR
MSDPNGERLGKETRRHVRIEICLRANFIIVGDAEAAAYSAESVNISRGGLCLKVTEKKREVLDKVGDVLPRFKVSLDLTEGDEPIDLGARTAWISSRLGWLLAPAAEDVPILIGMAFDELAPEDEEKIISFIADLLVQKRESIFKEKKDRLLEELGKIRRA